MNGCDYPPLTAARANRKVGSMMINAPKTAGSTG
jgi:hypothetical protein